ncbi:splicing factor 3B subunit 5/RDS3 complex subunit 10 [Globomyces pollinis-pini]|nr:splicing factor 3B subunit 5/RDS3 complex subunit 10 [Globomyces pollinis-pini]
MNTTQVEHLQAKFNGTGHADTNRYEWLQAQHRDSLASYVGHNSLIAHMAVAENKSIMRLRARFVETMVQPCGPPLEKIDD